MSNIAGVTIPVPTSSGLTFPIISDFGYGYAQTLDTVSHRFGENATQSYQTYLTGTLAKEFIFKRQNLNYTNRELLASFWETMSGSFASFTYNAPDAGTQSTTPYTVIFKNQPLTFEELVNRTKTGLAFVEVVTGSGPTHTINDTCSRIGISNTTGETSTTLLNGLATQQQQIIPLLHISVVTPDTPDMYLSDRLCTVGSNTYQPRLLNVGEKSKGVLIGQTLGVTGSAADTCSFTLNNADRIFTEVMHVCDMKYAEIDLCLYHVGTGILIQFWKGFIQNVQSDGTPQFKIMASDGVYNITQQYPIRTVSRSCWKTYNDGVNCPWGTIGGSLNTANYPSADATQCDKSWDGANGCLAHNGGTGSAMISLYFGGHPAEPQSVLIKDNSTGILGFAKQQVTCTSIVSDTVYGQALPEIWCNQGDSALNAYIANALVFDVRDEGNGWIDVAGIVGAGPIYAYTIDSNPTFTGSAAFGGEVVNNADGSPVLIAPLADGFPCQGFKLNSSGTSSSINNGLGLRQVLGNDPIPVSDQGGELFGLTQSTTPSLSPGEGLPFAAGTAFAELRYNNGQPSVQPSTPDEHSMTVPIAQGLTGWTWDAAGTRTAQGGLTNPAWIAINSYLRSLSLQNATSEEQLATFVLSSVFKGDGSGFAEVCDTLVTSLTNSAVEETQFQFQGSVARQRPFRDWLGDIINCALGYYTFEFGKLKLGCRYNAVDTDTFGFGNMLFQSLVCTPIDAKFEHLYISFADVEYQYQQNVVDYQDFTHAEYYGRAGNPLTQRSQSVGLSTMSQGLRVAATRTREELGGVEASEWIAARNVSFNTTLMALATEVGQVVEIVHPDMPGGSGNVRIQSWKLNSDWSVSIMGTTVTASMYDLDMGTLPSAAQAGSLPVLTSPNSILAEFAPYTGGTRANSADALWANEYSI